ncbi:hypothetical protein SYNPS1DRAFT_31303 [Syncephalis pseudoplumigaleata]|uniref:Uncharacterized protein n=1 Tax=Syncephalis pseudoplumigaleata TaxID=1712513 RepID=A0A4P9YTB7_9FUNG|nr:hypothetical protein SYNPS1DRAFT_31303 [Syncephalis pseudoplumigaleata]|eukprot:RKP23005.1 hypothetical protein SYNPS1DRAFT_31303 [Syncephalis pseudoplumigaleata]
MAPSPDRKRSRVEPSSRRYPSSRASTSTSNRHTTVPGNRDRTGGYIGGSTNRRAAAFHQPVLPPWHPAARLNTRNYAANPNWALQQQQQQQSYQQSYQHQSYQQQSYQQHQRFYEDNRFYYRR